LWYAGYALVVAAGAGGLQFIALMPREREEPPAPRRHLTLGRRSAMARGR
jgi:hypothetical protein